MFRKRGRPTKLCQAAVDRISQLRSHGGSYAAIAKELGITKRTLLNWSEFGRMAESGLHHQVRIALVGRESRDRRPSPPIVNNIRAVEYATILIKDPSGWRREDLAVTCEEVDRLRGISESRLSRVYDPRVEDRVAVEVCRPRAQAQLTIREVELTNGMLQVRAVTADGSPLRVEFLPKSDGVESVVSAEDESAV